MSPEVASSTQRRGGARHTCGVFGAFCRRKRSILYQCDAGRTLVLVQSRVRSLTNSCLGLEAMAWRIDPRQLRVTLRLRRGGPHRTGRKMHGDQALIALGRGMRSLVAAGVLPPSCSAERSLFPLRSAGNGVIVGVWRAAASPSPPCELMT